MWKKLKKGISTFFLCIVCLGLALGFVNCVGKLRKNFEPPSEQTIPVCGTLNERLSKVTGTASVKFVNEIELTVSEKSPTVLGAEGLQEAVIDGKNVGSITAKGGKQGIVQASKGGTLTFKNLTLNDGTENSLGGWLNYLHFGGKVKFENVTITDSIYLVENSRATFVNCTFLSSETKQYSVWVGNGSATFEGCTFEGYRGLKIHEFAEHGQDVKAVTITDCTFKNLQEKVGIAIGLVDKPTVITVTGSTFDQNTRWDTVGSLVGVDSFYECDTPLEDFTFIETDNTVIYDTLYDDSCWTKFY